MIKKYCLTPFSVSELKKIEEAYGGFSYENIRDFSRNQKVFDNLENNKVDTIYIFAQLLRGEEEYGGILSENIIATNDGIYSWNQDGIKVRIEEGSTISLFRVQNIPLTFRAFLTLYAKKYFHITIVSPVMSEDVSLLSTKCHGLYFLGGGKMPTSIVPHMNRGDVGLLLEHIEEDASLRNRFLVKESGIGSGKGVHIFSLDTDWKDECKRVLIEMKKDYIIMELLETTDIEYRILWRKLGEKIEILNIFGKQRINNNILHNIAQGNRLIQIERNILTPGMKDIIETFCENIPEPHGGLDVLETRDGRYYVTENNILTGYLSEIEQRYFAQEWLDSIADCYK